MAGNLMDNACKWAASRVLVRAVKESAFFTLSVEDDGPGLAAADRERVLERGERLDENVPGSGLGLSIVREISKLYGGGVELGAGALGGLCVRLRLPSIG